MENKKKIVYKNVSELVPYENNPRHNDDAVDYVANSIKNFHFQVPIVIDKNNVVIAGHTRLKACHKLGIKEVPCIVADDLTPEQVKAFRLADNKTSELAEWDMDKLDIELGEIPDIDMSAFGFDIEIDDIEEDTEVKEDEAPEVKDGEPKAKMGDIYQLGRHRLMCGDSTKAEDIDRLMDGAKAKLLLTDPPYGVKIVKGTKVGGDKPFGSTRGEAKNAILKAREYAPIIGDDTTDTARINYEITKNYTDNQIIFGGNYFTDFLPPSRCWIIWDKEVPKESFFAQVEMAWCSKDGNAKIYKYLWSGLCREGDRKTELNARVHPTQKPVGLFAEILSDFSEPGDNIIDCFGGSGSTLIACEQTNRNCYMMELEPHYIDVIIERWENFTGQKAKLLKGV